MFTTRKINDHIYSITDLAQVHSFLVLGKERALLIDTGIGLGDLKSCVESLTALPLTVIGTHGHLDHIGGAGAFPQVLLKREDHELAADNGNLPGRKDYVKLNTSPEQFDALADADYIPERRDPYGVLEDHQVFDLGGYTARILPLPGHTPGMVTVLFPEDRIVLTGDACNPWVFLFLPESSSVETYRRNLIRYLDSYGALFDSVLLSHGEERCPKSVITDCIQVCEDILAGRDDKVPFSFMGKTAARVGKQPGETSTRADAGKYGNIVYDPSRITDGAR